MEQLSERFEMVNNIWEHYKSVNDARLEQIEKKGSADAMVLEQLDKLNTAIDEQKEKIGKIEVSMARPSGEYKAENTEYKNAISNYLKKGIENPLIDLERKSDLTTSIESGGLYGGYLLSPNMSRNIMDAISDLCIMRKICSVQNIGSGALEIVSSNEFEASWISETGTVNDTNSATIQKQVIKAHELVAQPKVTQKLMDDSFINIEEFIADKIADKFADKEEEAFIKGEGDSANQPMGILNKSNIDKILSTESESFNQKDLIDLYYNFPQKHLGRASWMMSRQAIAKIRMLKDDVSGDYLWQPALLGGDRSDTILGHPVHQSSHMPNLAANSLAIIFGDFKYYQIVDRTDIRILRDPYTAKPYIRFYTTKRVGGDVINKDAFVVLKCSD